MHGDFSRLTFDPAKRYSRVWMQQGRVQLDADWNELVEMLNHRLETECRDRIGPCAVPKDHPGFGLRIRKGLKFDGIDDFVWVGENNAFSFVGCHPFTIATWINPDASGTGGTIVSKFHPHTPTPTGEYCLSVQPDRTIQFQRVELRPAEHLLERVIAVLSETRSVEASIEAIVTLQAEQEWERVIRTVTTTRSIPSGQFSHIAVVYDRHDIRIYLNGKLSALSPSSHPAAHSHVPLVIGATFHPHTPTHSFSGVIDDVQIWRTARTQPQIQNDLQCPLTQPQTGLVSNWQFTEGDGNQIEDWSGNGHTGWRDGDREPCRPAWVPVDLWIGSGRCYVDGVLCENEGEIRLTDQPGVADRLHALTDRKSGASLLYLDVWARFVSAIEDPSIREVALGGIDTTARSQTIWQVRALPLPHNRSINRDQAHLLLETALPSLDQRGKLKVKQTAIANLPDNRLYRIEIHSSGGAYGDRASARWQSACAVHVRPTAKQVAITDGWSDHNWTVGQCVELSHADDTEPGTLAQIVAIDSDHHYLTLDTLPPDWSADTSGKLRAIATCKWSRDNGALVFAIDQVEHQSVILQDWRQTNSLLQAGNWVEIMDDTTVLSGLDAPLYQIDSIEPGISPIVHLKQPLVGTIGQDATQHPLLRCWDQTQNTRMGVIPVCLTANTAIELENGVQIEFEGSQFQRGDFWWIPTRTATEGGTTQGVAWATDADGQLLARSPHGIAHAYTPLAVLHISDGKPHIHDLRQFFAPQSEAAVSKTGDTMSGPLTIDANLAVTGDTCLNGHVDVGLLSGQLAANLVDTAQLVDRSVTAAKLADNVGTIPPGVCILGTTPEPPRGYTATGLTLHLPQPQFPWHTDPTHLPQPGRLTAVAVHHQIFAIYHSGEVWAYDPRPQLGVNDWVPQPSIPQPHRHAFGVAVMAGHIYVVGGMTSTGKRSDRVDRYDPKAGEWVAVPPLPTPRSHLGVAAIGHHLHAIGGLVETTFPFAKDRAVAVHEVYSAATNTWVTKQPLPIARYGMGMGVAKGRLYAIAGKRKWFFNRLGKVRSHHTQMYSPTTGTWFDKPALPIAKSHLAVAVIGDKLYATGGKSLLEASPGIDVYDAAAEAWSEEFQMSIARESHGAVGIDGKLYVLGGHTDSGAIDTLEVGSVLSTVYIHQKLD